MTSWEYRQVPFKFQLSDWTLFSLAAPMQVRAIRLADGVAPVEAPIPPTDAPVPGSQGFSIRAMPVTSEQPSISYVGGYIRYIPLQYHHYYIDLGLSFEEYKNKFSSKTRSTINRKLKKFTQESGGQIHWLAYQQPEQMAEFYKLARAVSQKTYQEKLLDAGLPDGEAFLDKLKAWAEEDKVRAYILFKDDKPISYLCCPANEGVLVYAYQGYDPAYMQLSVGTVLQWLALEQLFAEQKFRLFDFTEGQSEHKRLFATDHHQCANVIFLKNTARNRLLVRAHWLSNRASQKLGDVLNRFGLKAKLKKLLRFGR